MRPMPGPASISNLEFPARTRSRHSRGRGGQRLNQGSAWFIAVCLVQSVGCERHPPPKLEPALDVRPVRVLLLDGTACRIRVDGPFRVRDSGGGVLLQGSELPWTSVVVRGGIVIGDAVPAPGPLVLETDALTQVVAESATDVPAANWYSGSLEFIVRDNSLRVINHVDIEAYVAGVVAQEAWPTFHDEALRAQAIAARTYALYLMSERDLRPFDLRAGEGDQVYRGVRQDAFGIRAAEAVDATRGIVLSTLTDEGLRIFCAYYAAACGGRTQSVRDYQGGGAAVAVPPPLAGGVACDDCRIAPGDAYRWGVQRIAKSDLLVRLRERDRTLADWPALAGVTVASRTEFGRIREVTVAASDGRQVTLGGENFRLAVGSRVMRSTDCNLVDMGDTIVLENGKGFGHGLGMCQWGAEGWARQGRRAGEILLRYYPGAQIVRAY